MTMAIPGRGARCHWRYAEHFEEGYMKYPAALSCLVLLTNCASAPIPELPLQRSMEEMHGDCTNFSWDMSREFSLWSGSVTSVAASSTPDTTPIVTINRPTLLALAAQENVRFARAPEADRGGADRFAGLVSFVPAQDGLYRISASSGVWIDAVQNGEVVSSARFEMQTRCATIFKSVAYRLRGNEPVMIQINGSRTGEVRLLVSAWR
jgi:hypothetical protein